ncbi:hypothetical protein E7Z57_20920 (plasmid) [Ralstonia pseudosolanacearum]|uniref:Uncharacterized protein n=1 Tax=Ralstonia solanacearum TaxID=305 RepID=A0AA92EGA5_RALSL|nr:hypothetical protein E7Z57_20920 [Ralstonia pseudosolanacearum]
MDNTTGRRANRLKTQIAKRMRSGNEDAAMHPERSGNAALIANRFQRPYGGRKKLRQCVSATASGRHGLRCLSEPIPVRVQRHRSPFDRHGRAAAEFPIGGQLKARPAPHEFEKNVKSAIGYPTLCARIRSDFR